MITFEEVTQTVVNLLRRINELEVENKALKEALNKNVREPDDLKKEGN